MIVTSTKRLTLRHASPDDAKALRDVFGDPEVMRFGPGPQSDDWIRSWITRMKRDYEEHGYGLWVVTETGNPTALGYCGLTWFPDINGRPEVEVGYRLARQCWGRGFATEAAIAVRELAFSDFGLDRLIALIDPANQRSIKVARKLGMTYESDVLLDGYDYPDNVYSCGRDTNE